jgi:hypothetical protein
MARSLPRSSTRASKARRPPPRPRRKPAPLSDAERVAKGELPITAFHHLRVRLSLIFSTAMVVERALGDQVVLPDTDAADVLKHHVCEPLFGQILRLKVLLGEVTKKEADEYAGEDAS